MSVEYAPRGLLGVLTPQANTTVEPELAVLMPAGTAWINARLVSRRGSIADRLVDYFENYGEAVKQFSNAPVAAVAFACTGASYLAGVEAEADTLDRISDALGVPALTAGSAVADALAVLGARRIALVSPYDEVLNRASGAYWAARGFEVVARSDAWRESDAFHPIYSLGSAEAQAALDRLETHPRRDEIEAVVMLGTGMPTLSPIARTPRIGRAPVMSCMLCLAWRAVTAMARREPAADDLLAWIAAHHWRERLISG